jgi:benzoyl-CoA reductase subunit D
MKVAIKEAGLEEKDEFSEIVERFCTTGVGREDTPFKGKEITEVGADAKGIHYLFPSVRTCIDVGAEEGRAIKISPEGKVVDFAINEKCAAGAGAFTEAMARALEVTVDEFGKMSLKSDKNIPMNAQCAVFAESEVVSLIHAKTPKEDISKAVHDAIADRIVAMVRRVGVEKDVALIGGVALNGGFQRSLREGLELEELKIPEGSEQYVGAIGAALAASED